jgi:hypothetical protein
MNKKKIVLLIIVPYYILWKFLIYIQMDEVLSDTYSANATSDGSLQDLESVDRSRTADVNCQSYTVCRFSGTALCPVVVNGSECAVEDHRDSGHIADAVKDIQERLLHIVNGAGRVA